MKYFVLKMCLVILCVAGAGFALFALGLSFYGNWHDRWMGYGYEEFVSDGYCNIAVVELNGTMTVTSESIDSVDLAYEGSSSADAVVDAIRRAEADPWIEGIVLRVDSYGGSPVAGEMILQAMDAAQLPTAALVREAAVSAGYMAAIGADHVIVSPFSDVGGIGVTMSYLDYSQQNSLNGIQFVELASAEFKDYGTSERPLTQTERGLLERDLAVFHEAFIDLIVDHRRLNRDHVASLADGSMLPGRLAVEAGLADVVGAEAEAKEWFARALRTSSDAVSFCDAI